MQSFKIIVLGCSGGPHETDISGYLLYPQNHTDELLVLDAGTLLGGLAVAEKNECFQDFDFEDQMLRPMGEIFLKKIRGYLISHAHLDHISALVINSQADVNKFIAGTDRTIDDLRDHIFNTVIWPNYGSEGQEPMLRKYQYIRLPYQEMHPLPNTQYRVESYRLSHPHDYPSTAFLIEYAGSYLVYFGDTAPDALEKEKYLQRIWKRIAPLIREKKFRGMILECSVPNEDSAQVIFGHLNPKLMMQELEELEREVGDSIRGLKIVVSHRKTSLYRKENQKQIEKQLEESNHLGVDFIFPFQGAQITL